MLDKLMQRFIIWYMCRLSHKNKGSKNQLTVEGKSKTYGDVVVRWFSSAYYHDHVEKWITDGMLKEFKEANDNPQNEDQEPIM